MGATRFPGKVLKNLNGKPVLWHVVNRCRASKSVDKVVVATTTEKGDAAIEQFCKKNKIPCFRGSSGNVLSRYYEAAKKFKIDIVARITSDCPLTDPSTIDICLNSFLKQKSDYISNMVPGKRTYPIGLSVEIFKFKALEKAYKEAHQEYEKEHVTPYIWENRKNNFKIGNIVPAPRSLNRPYRLTVDYQEDFALLDMIYEKFSNYKLVPLTKVISFLDKHPEIASINSECEKKYHAHAPINLARDNVSTK